MPEIVVDGRHYQVNEGANLLQALLSLGLDLPYFCWHPALGSVGACRQCAVIQYRDDSDASGRLVMACMTPVSEGLSIGLQAPDARAFRAGIIELLMTNHPHDCPVCEEGGECHLQDMTVMTGHVSRRFRGLKRTHRNQDLGPFINHEMNRCIACYRCVRYYRDYAGGTDLDVYASRNQVYFGRFEDGVLESEFSGNLVEVCPTGVFTDKTFSAHYSRKWDLQTAPAICVHCGVGCNISPGERYGRLKRVVNRYHGQINGYFLCDRGRFGYGFVNAESRIRTARRKGEPVDREAARRLSSELLQGRLVGIGSPRASLEANFALRDLVGAENFHAGVDDTEYALLNLIVTLLQEWPIRSPTLREMEQADAVLVLGEDVADTAPRLALALRQAVRNHGFAAAADLKIPHWQDGAVRELAQDRRSALYLVTVAASRLDDVATQAIRAEPGSIARLGQAVAAHLDAAASAPDGLSSGERETAIAIAAALQAARRPLLVCGAGCRSVAVLQAAANIALALAGLRGRAADVGFVVPECNSLGLALLGGRPLAEALTADHADTVLVLENDLYRRAERRAVDRFLASAASTIVIDHTGHRTAEQAELVLPGGSFAETEGTLINAEGRAQRYFSVMPPPADADDSWRWLAAMQPQKGWTRVDDLTRACAAAIPALARIPEAAPRADFRIDGLRVARQLPRYSGRTAMVADISIHEPKPPEDPDSALCYSMEGDCFDAPPALRPVSWAPGWDSNQQSAAKFQQEVGGALRGGDPGVRLFEPPTPDSATWYPAPLPDPPPQSGWMRAVPLYHVFGSEELSVLTPAVAQRAPSGYVALHPADAALVGAVDTVEIVWGEDQYTLPHRSDVSLPRGVVGVAAGLPGMPPGPCPERLRIGRVRGSGKPGSEA